MLYCRYSVPQKIAMFVLSLKRFVNFRLVKRLNARRRLAKGFSIGVDKSFVCFTTLTWRDRQPLHRRDFKTIIFCGQRYESNVTLCPDSFDGGFSPDLDCRVFPCLPLKKVSQTILEISFVGIDSYYVDQEFTLISTRRKTLYVGPN